MSIDALIQLFEESQILDIIVLFFLVNVAITGIELILDLLTHKERR